MKTEYTISQIAEKLHITTNKIRFYEKKGLLTPMRESQNRYRKFGEEDIFRLETILLYRSLGLSIEAIQNILQCNKKENYLTHMQNQWMAVNNEIHRLSEIRKSLEMVLDKIYEETEGQDLEKDFLKIIEQSNLLCQVKNEWKDQWDFDGWARAYDEDVKRDTGALKIYENYETVLQMVFEEVEKFQRKDGKILEIGVGTGNLAGKFLQNKYHIIGIDQSRQMLAVAKENLYAEAVCVENGRIQAVGTLDDVMQYKTDGDEMVDLQGKTMLPGFLDAHSHFVGAANAMTQCDLSECGNFSEIVDAMKMFAEKRNLSKDAWIVGCNYDQNFLEEKRHPDRYVLDEISHTNPVLLIHASSHMGVVNSKGLEIQQIDEKTEDCPGGKYGRIAGTRIPDGYMEEKAFLAFQSKLPMTSMEELMQLIGEAQKMYASYGVTTVQDGMVGKPLFELLKYASANGLLKLDVVGYADIMTAADLFEEERAYANRYTGHLKMGGYKIFLDGSPQGRTAWMTKPYEGEENYCGYPIHTDEELNHYIELALEKKQQLLAHCNGDAAAEQYIGQFEKALSKRTDKDLHRAVMVHAQLVRKDQLQRMAAIGMIPSFFVAHTYYWGDIHLQNFGEKRGSQISPVKDAIDYGMKYTFHQDTPVIPPDMMRTISSAVNRISRGGRVIGENQKISVLDALKAVTIYAAYQYFEEHEKGSIECGKYADFVVLEKNPLKTPKEELAEIKVWMTIKENEVIYRSGEANHE